LRELAKTVAHSPESELTSRLAAAGFQFSQSDDSLDVKIENEDVPLDLSTSRMRVSSNLFDQAKEVERRVEASRRAYASLQEELRKQTAKLDQQTVRRSTVQPTIIQEKAWFERYRWFRTSSGHLAIGGRDASSNSSLIRKHMEDNDIVFHADIYGSPFFILKSGVDAPETARIETATAVVSFSSAWKAGLSAGDVYWVTPNQIKMQAPSGMYLPKGSFIVEGKKNFIRNLKLGITIGLARSDEEWRLICGPAESISKSAVCYVTLGPDRAKPTDTAKAVKSALLNCSEHSARVAAKAFSIDEFLTLLPAGGGMIVNRHNC
jgi:predicted ribosome quality control (RQC) complex YloA/Tae2 family protein